MRAGLDGVYYEAACGCKIMRKVTAEEERITVEPCTEEHADGLAVIALAQGAEVRREAEPDAAG